jgi:ribonuclease HI
VESGLIDLPNHILVKTNMTIEDALNIYTDGSSYSSPRMGGIGIRFVTIDELGNDKPFDVDLPGYQGATNNQMELQACIQALKEAQKKYNLMEFKKIVINSDSRYVVNNYKNALFYWSKSGWKNLDGRPVENANLWKEFLKQVKRTGRRVDLNWVKGHSKDIHNKAVDKMAKKSAKNPLNKPLSVVSVRRKISSKATQIGSVEMLGQRLSIRIITTEYFRLQKLYKYRYEVMSKTSKYFGNVDLIFSEISIRDGHCYKVTMNRNTKNPTIMKVLSEIDTV